MRWNDTSKTLMRGRDKAEAISRCEKGKDSKEVFYRIRGENGEMFMSPYMSTMSKIGRNKMRPLVSSIKHYSKTPADPLRGRRSFSTASGEGESSREEESFDYVIVGAGSAGCVLANRLTESGNHSVLLIEYGGSDVQDPRSIFIHMPTCLAIPMNMKKYNWFFESEPEPGLGGRRLHCPRGKVIGGSSSINGMVFVRGNARDFDHWEEEHGAREWSFRHCLPYFKKMETWRETNDPDWRGQDGPLTVCNGPVVNPLYRAFIDAGIEAGYGATQDYNGYRQEGFGKMAMTVKDGVRASTANAFLRVKKVVLEGKKAVGIKYKVGNVEKQARARRETILSAGAVGSPHLLQLSGVGDSSHLSSIGVETCHHLPGVGQNLQDHLELLLQYRCKQPVSLYDHLNIIGKLRIGIQWILTRKGLGATNHMEAAGFIRSDAGIEYPDIQYHFMPVAASYDGNSVVEGHGFQAHCGPMRSKSRGHILARTRNVQDHPKILFNYLTHDQDKEEWRKVVRLTREIIAQPAMDPFRGEEISPGAQVLSDQDIDEAVRQKG
ncbi:hypothetical protein GUITHDRAFT_163854 [Guillardia theta CCMP2712]|uniref:Glucose-methanol-choline oxidoreductase N-terminal domain-containing protein n=1 Tax=Guillardia theta (strain CCMP2712) TaxID=905079 RepID=L1J4L3_GUITC|nr:hypothetical protein GUITHDRAFT_163854 [Guillardia theta CCMP2712]EKX43468.1 hypothetical protein GUITHDRAFT_163854 [Guillardia theta CCMP2712]|eukprot:XP_005830448.1 hypothetical protein GUITHDRAFT_163854 [Guillardia theta CCMP2712]